MQELHNTYSTFIPALLLHSGIWLFSHISSPAGLKIQISNTQQARILLSWSKYTHSSEYITDQIHNIIITKTKFNVNAVQSYSA